MKNRFFNFSIVVILLSVFFVVPVVEAKTTKAVTVKKVVAPAKVTKSKIKVVKKSVKTVSAKNVAHVFSAKEAASATSFSGKLPPAGYMEALKVAEDNLMAAKAKAHGNKAKIDAAIAEYDVALNEAQKLLD